KSVEFGSVSSKVITPWSIVVLERPRLVVCEQEQSLHGDGGIRERPSVEGNREYDCGALGSLRYLTQEVNASTLERLSPRAAKVSLDAKFGVPVDTCPDCGK